MQRTEKQILASRLNGAKSRGPVTPEGKLRSCQNAIRHQALARSITLEMEDSSLFLANLDDLCDRWKPVDITEHKLVESMAGAQWKKDRYEVCEKVASDQRIDVERHNIIPHTHLDAAVISQAVIHMVDRERTIKSLNQIIALLDRQYIRALNMLMKVKQYRRLNPDQGDLNSPAPAELEAAPTGVQETGTTESATEIPEAAATVTERAGERLTTLITSSTRKRTHNLLDINTQPNTQPAEPAPGKPAIEGGRRALGGAAA